MSSFRTVIVKSRSRLSYKNGYMVIRNEDVKMIHLSEISTVLIDTTAVSITSFLMAELAKQKVNVIFCDEEHNPASECIPLFANYHSAKNIKTQIQWDENFCDVVWQSIIRAKIENQAKVLQKYSLSEQEKMLNEYAADVMIGDRTNREGHSAKVYFNALFGKDFSRKDDTYVNAALNYGYAVILSSFNKEVVSAGYLTQLGIFHRNEFNEFNLSCDLMEPFRPIIDNYIKQIYPFKFDETVRFGLVDLLNSKLSYCGKEYYLDSVISIYVRNVINAIEKKIISEDIFVIDFL